MLNFVMLTVKIRLIMLINSITFILPVKISLTMLSFIKTIAAIINPSIVILNLIYVQCHNYAECRYAEPSKRICGVDRRLTV